MKCTFKAVVAATLAGREALAVTINRVQVRGALVRTFVLMVCCLAAVSNGAIAEDFSWRAHLGLSGDKLQNELKTFSSCGFVKPISFFLPASIPPDWKITIEHWHDPIPRPRLFSADDERVAESNQISELNCSADMGVDINAILFENIVFEITLYYTRCKEVTCNKLVPTVIDKSLAMRLPENILYDPVFGKNTERYFQTYSSMLSDLYLRDKLSDAGNCGWWDPAKYRCIVIATANDGIWHAITMAELFESGFFSERILGRFASRQRFTLMEADRRAWAAFTSEVTSKVHAVIENQKRLHQEENRIRELREGPLQSVR